KPHIAWQLTESVRGLGDACRALDVPVVGGNVSLYNEGPEGPIYPTPIVGMVGWLPDPARVPASWFTREGDAIALIGPFAPAAASCRHRRGRSRGSPNRALSTAFSGSGRSAGTGLSPPVPLLRSRSRWLTSQPPSRPAFQPSSHEPPPEARTPRRRRRACRPR